MSLQIPKEIISSNTKSELKWMLDCHQNNQPWRQISCEAFSPDHQGVDPTVTLLVCSCWWTMWPVTLNVTSLKQTQWKQLWAKLEPGLIHLASVSPSPAPCWVSQTLPTKNSDLQTIDIAGCVVSFIVYSAEKVMIEATWLRPCGDLWHTIWFNTYCQSVTVCMVALRGKIQQQF